MDANEASLIEFSTRVRQMILQYKDVKKENTELTTMLDERNAKIKLLEEELANIATDYNNLKTAKMVEITDGDLETSKKKVAKLIRDVDRCITLLSDK